MIDPPDYENYDYAKEWRHRELTDLAEKTIIRKLAGHPGKTIELGGGFGRITQELESISRECYMVDFSDKNISEARQRLKKTTIRKCNFFDLPFEDDTFDLVVMIRVMHHIESPELIYREMERVSVNGGTVIVSVPNIIFHRIKKENNISLLGVGTNGHKIYGGPLESFLYPKFSLEGIYGTGILDNAFGKIFRNLKFLYHLDTATSRLWKFKNNLFLKFRVVK